MSERELTLQDLLRECTLRVDVGGDPKGTGFYVAPATIVTAAHVVEAVTLSSGVGTPRVTVVGPSGVPQGVEVEKRWPEEDVDLAILKLTTLVEHSCVLLDVEFRERDEVDSFGYTEKYPEGRPLTSTVEGELGPPKRWIQLKLGQVQPGQSGAAVVNTRTGGVFGVLKRSRNPETDLGSYAVPVTTLYRLEPRLKGENERAHAKGSRWVSWLPYDVRALRQASQQARPAEAAPATLMVVSVGQTQDGWQVTADIHPGGEVVGPVPIDLNSVRQQVARLFRDWASRGRIQQEGEITLLGSILFRALFPGEIATRLAELQQSGNRVALSVRFDQGTDCDLIELPWEHAYYEEEGGKGVSLARVATLTFARVLERAPAPAGVPKRRSLKVLVVAVHPQWEDAQTVAQVDEVVDGLKATAQRIGAVDVVTIDDFSPDVFTVGEQLADAQVVHYVGFGRYSGGVDALALGGEGPHGIEYPELELLATELGRGATELLVLQLLTGPANEFPADFSVLAQRLMERSPGIPAVLASQYPTAVEFVKKFNDTLYEHLARGTPIDVAVQEARSKLGRGRVSVAPALIVRAPGERRLTAPGRDVVRRGQVGAFGA